MARVIGVSCTMTRMALVSDRLRRHGMGGVAFQSVSRGMLVRMSHVDIVLVFIFGLRLIHRAPSQIAFIPFVDSCFDQYGLENRSVYPNIGRSTVSG